MLGPLLLGKAGNQPNPKPPPAVLLLGLEMGSGSSLEGRLEVLAHRVPRDCWGAGEL